MKTVAEFDVDFAGIVPMESAESYAVVEFHAAVGDIDCVYGGGELVAEILAQSYVERCVLRQIVSGIRLAGKGVGETGAVIDVGGSVGAPGEGQIAADIERVALVVIEGAPRKIGKIGQTAVDESARPRHLIGIGKMKLCAVRNARRAHRKLPAADKGVLNGQREKQIGLANIVVIEKVRSVGAKHVGVENPAAPGDVHAEFFFFVTFTMERDERQVVVVRELQKGARGSDQRRRLIVMAVGGAEGPV